MTTSPPAPRYDPWHDLASRWPEVEVLTAPLAGRLLGVLHYPAILLRADSSPAQQRCTLAHEIAHLERGGSVCWDPLEERRVHRIAAARLVPMADLAEALHAQGGDADRAALAAELGCDRETLAVRLSMLTEHEVARIGTSLAHEPSARCPQAAVTP